MIATKWRDHIISIDDIPEKGISRYLGNFVVFVDGNFLNYARTKAEAMKLAMEHINNIMEKDQNA